jgi:hypothetical protein
MATRDIRTFHESVVCDMCGRTLLRGEHAETYLAGGSRREVCDLCADRALHEGWVREDARLEAVEPAGRSDRGRSLLGRLRQRRERAADRAAERAAERAAAHSPPEPPPEDPVDVEPEPEQEPEPEPEPAPAPAPRRPRRRPPPEAAEPVAAEREPRSVRAVPTSAEQRTLAALELFNATEHTRTVSGVSRSLGQPTVAAQATGPGGRVTIVVSWELCWYRYEVELDEDGSRVHQAAQGYELSELPPEDRLATAAADEYGRLHAARGQAVS